MFYPVSVELLYARFPDVPVLCPKSSLWVAMPYDVEIGIGS